MPLNTAERKAMEVEAAKMRAFKKRRPIRDIATDVADSK